MSAKKIWMPKFLLEYLVRRYINSLFAMVVGAHENARTMLSYEPSMESLTTISAGGYSLARYRFHWVMRWLAHLREYSRSDELFRNQLLEPARCTARFKIEMESTTDITSLVFSKSKSYYDNSFQCNVSWLSLVVPSLECGMSIKCRDELTEKVTFGLYDFNGVQPLPYVNRIHPVRLSIQRTDLRPRLDTFNFLKVPIRDLLFFTHSLALENYCEVESIKFGKRRLGASCIVGGRLASARMPQLMLQSLRDPKFAVQMLATKHLLNNMNSDLGEIESLEGQTVRMLCCVWYVCGHEEVKSYPEVFFIEPVNDRSELLWDEIIGEVRLHGQFSLETASHIFQDPVEQSQIPKVLNAEADGLLRWNSRQPMLNRIEKMFLQETDRLKELRLLLGECKPSPLVFPRHLILDRSKLQERMLAQRLLRDQELSNCLYDLIRRQDSKGEIGKSFSSLVTSFSEIDQEVSREKLWWLRDFGFLTKTKIGMQITKRGLKIAYLANNRSIKQQTRDLQLTYRNEAMTLGALCKITNLSPSLLLMGLKDLENGWLNCFKTAGERCELIWILGYDDISEKGMQKLKTMQSEVLNVLEQFYYPLGTSKILEELCSEDMTHYVLELLLSEMKSKSILTEPNKGMWLYPWETRIENVLSQDPYPVLDTEELMKIICVPYIEKNNMLQTLKKMKQKGIIKELEKRKWALDSSNENIRQNQLLSLCGTECNQYILDCIKNQGGWVKLDRLLASTRLFLRKRLKSFELSNALELKIFDKCIKCLQDEGKLAMAGTIVRLVRNIEGNS